jgi:hypothetical protein
VGLKPGHTIQVLLGNGDGTFTADLLKKGIFDPQNAVATGAVDAFEILFCRTRFGS